MHHCFNELPDHIPFNFSGKGLPVSRVLSLGAGVQSTVMALKADRGDFGVIPDIAIFADTGWEPKKVYDHLDWLEGELKNIKILRVKVKSTARKRPRNENGQFIKANLRDHLMQGVNSSGNKFITVPLFIINKDGKPAIGRRQCTREYKVTPIQKAIRKYVLKLKKRQLVPKGQWVEQWIGISTDEMVRMKDNRDHWLMNRWPLIEGAMMSREDCKAWFAKHYPNRHLPRSACIGCPLRTHAEWLDMKENDPESWNEAVAFDKALRTSDRTERFGAEMYLNAKRVPLSELGVLPLFETNKTRKEKRPLEECEGMCGV